MIGLMREQFMHYNMKKILGTSALALILSLGFVHVCSAQGVVSLSDSAKADDNANEIPDEISLFGDDSADVKVITPAKSTTGVKSAAEILGKKNKKAQQPQAKPSSGVKSAKELLAARKSAAKGNVKSAAELLGNKNSKKDEKAPEASAQALNDKKDNKVQSATSQPSPATVLKSPQGIDMQLVSDVDDSIFNQMSDLEKQTAILNLELKKERVKSDIESLKAVQEKAKEEEKARQEEKKRKAQAWENEEKRKLLQEQQKLKNLEIAYEQERQEKILKNYKNKMLEQSQDMITAREEMFQEIAKLKEEREALINDFKGRFLQLTKIADQVTSDAIRVRDSYAKTVSDLQTQISILNARLEANDRKNPFAENSNAAEDAEEKNAKLSDLYAVMEIRGQGNKIAAKLINESGIPFMVKVGTALQSGHIIDEISSTYVRADKEGVKSYLYFSAGGVLDKEPEQNEELKIKVSSPEEEKKAVAPAVMTTGIPSVASEMTIR